MQDTVISLFEGVAKKNPEKIAVISGTTQLSYSALDEQAERVATALSFTITRGQRIVICLSENPLSVLISILGILKLGCIYVPIDPKNPQDRIRYLLTLVKPALVVCDTTTAYLIQDRKAVVFESLLEESRDGKRVLIDSKATDTAYIVFTSGSTGMPKGVAISHSNLFYAYLAWEEVYNLKDIKTHLQIVSYSFDVFSGDWVRSLCSGSTLVMCPESVAHEPEKLLQVITENQIECAEFLPVVLRALFSYLEAKQEKLESFKILICGSDKWFVTEYLKFKKCLSSNTRLINSYGTSETTIDTSWFEFTEANNYLVSETIQVPIGKPFPRMELLLLNENQEDVSKGEVGEIYIGGSGVSEGYVDAVELNQIKFISNIPGRSGRYYRTGDAGKLLTSGDIEFLGREDGQVKFRGKRISLVEIENALITYFPISDSAVVLMEEDNIEHLVAFITPKNGAILASLQKQLSNYIPEYMLPQTYITLPALPTNLNGKIDKKVLLTKLQAREYLLS